MEITQGALGSEGQYSIVFKEGKAILEAAHVHASGKVALVIEQDACYFLDQLAQAIPGTIDDALLTILKAAVKSI